MTQVRCWRIPAGTHSAAGWLLAALILAALHGPLSAQARLSDGSSTTGLPVPRFVSLKSDRVNLRSGPGTDYATAWVFRRAGLPVEIIKEHEGWRQVRDAEGTTGWVLQNMLSGRRTALVLPWELKPGQPVPEIQLKESDRDGANPVALIEAGVIANVRGCDKRWCAVVIGDFRGFLEQSKLWGVYAEEIVK